MPAFQRFDLEGGPQLSERELKRRWAAFHDSIRIRSGSRLQQVIGRMLGENTIRYRLARIVGRPVLKFAKALKGQRHVPVAKSDVVAPTYFPHNYRPNLAAPAATPGEPTPNLADVAVVKVNDEATSVPEQVAELNRVLRSTDATWLFIGDSASSDDATAETLRSLLGRALPHDDVVFADEHGPNPLTPILKSPSVGPHTLLSYNVVGRPALLRVERLRASGGFSPESGRAYEHDAYLRLSEAGATFHHVPVVLDAGRTAQSFASTDLDHDTCVVVQAALDRRGWQGTVEPGHVGGVVRWTLAVPTPAPSVDIVIPTRDRLDLVLQCIEAVETKTTYPNYDIIILDNDSKDPATLAYFATTKYRVVACPGPFNYAHIVNRGISHSTADFVVTLNNDTILVTPDWLERMVGLASLPDVGIVGGCLLDQHGHFEHESIVISPYPQHLRSDSNYPHADQFTAATRDVAAVTGAVQMVEREFWNALGGMDEQLKVTMNDVDICLRSQLEGRHVVYTPDVQLYHHVSSSRGALDPLEDRNRFISRWDIFGSFQDPYFPESLLLLGETMYYRYR